MILNRERDMSEPVRVPTLDDLADQPEMARTLPRVALTDLGFRLLRAQAAVQTAMAAMPAEQASPTAQDEPLEVEEAARRLGIAPATLYRQARKRYRGLLVETGTRNLRFSAAAIEAYRQRAAQRA
jgi:predicted DNA-binding transcriptional regulator AlpA